MKVALIVGVFPADLSHLEALADSVDLIVYGTQRTLPWHHWSPQPPRQGRARIFNPLVPTKRGQILWVYPGMRSVLDTDKPDIVHVISEPWGTLAVQATSWARRNLDTALVVHGCDRIWWHGSAVEQKVRRVLAKRTLARADGYAAETDAAVDKARASGLSPGAKTATIHTNPRNPEIFRPPASVDERNRARETVGVPQNGVGIGFMARLIPAKGPIEFLDAVERVRKITPDAWAAMAGEGPLEEEVKVRCADLGVHYLGSLPYPDRVADFYRSIDVFAVPSYTTPDWDEQSPRALIESMMSGCVVVGSRCGALPEMIGDTGFVVEEKNVDSLVTGLSKAVEAYSDEALRKAAVERVTSKYSGAAIAGQLEDLWKSVRVRSYQDT